MDRTIRLLSFGLLLLMLAPQMGHGQEQRPAALAAGRADVLTGFNQNFSMMPYLSPTMCDNIRQLRPRLLRYPGGTVTHSWDWRRGVITSRKSRVSHPIDEVKKLADYTGAKFVFVLDVLNKSVEDQIQMLASIEQLGVEVAFIEMGNELYAQNEEYVAAFPSGKDYALRVNSWIPELRKRFPKAKIAALLLGRKVRKGNERMYSWNRQVVDATFNGVDAYIYHIYINPNSTFEQEKSEFVEVTQNAKTGSKELWITEYGSNQDRANPTYYVELEALSNFVESFPNVTIALNHQLVGGTKNKLTEDGSRLVEEGQLFLRRAQR